MSKKHNNSMGNTVGHSSHLTHEAEYKIIKNDLYKVLALNVVYLVAIIALYYTDRNSHYLSNWFAKILNF